MGKSDNTEQSAQETGQKQYVARKRWVFLGLPFTFTKYTVGEDILTIDTGFFRRDENDCYMYKVQDVEFTASFILLKVSWIKDSSSFLQPLITSESFWTASLEAASP